MEENPIEIATNLIRQFEGYKSQAYQDQKGVWTIGYGTTVIDGHSVCMTDKCTEYEATTWLADHVAHDYQTLTRLVINNKIQLNAHEKGSLLSFIYNIGFANFLSSSVYRDLITNNLEKVRNHLLEWNKIRIKGNLTFSQGLENRREAEAKEFYQPTNEATS